MTIKFKKLNETAIVPKRATGGAVGYDLIVNNIFDYKEDQGVLYLGTGLAIELPEGYHSELFPRSSISKLMFTTGPYKVTLMMANSIGLIDSDYRGELIFAFRLLGDWNQMDSLSRANLISEITKEFPMRVGQLVIRKTELFEIEEVEDLVSTERGAGGFGSTG